MHLKCNIRVIRVKVDFDHRPGRLPRIPGNARNHGNDRKFYKSHQILINQIKRNVNNLCLGKT